MTLSLIGGHMTKNGLGAGYSSRVCLSIQGNGLGEQHADTIVLFRDVTVYNDGPPDLHTHPQRRSIEFAQYWYEQLKPIWQANAHRVNYFTITNELGGSNPDHIMDHIAYEANICELAAADGLKCAVGKLAGDSPDWNTNLWEELYAPFIVQMWNQYGAIYARHVYGGDLVDGNGNPTDDPPGNPQRAILEADYLRRLGYGGGMVLAECGIDGGYGVADYGRFRAQALGYEAALRPYADIIIGLCFWECGTSGFEANYTGHLMDLRPLLDTSLPKWEGNNNMTTEQKIYDLSQSWAFPVNEQAALQKKALADGFTPSGVEQWHDVDGKKYAMQPFYRIGETNSKRSYYAVVGDWGNVKYTPSDEQLNYIDISPLNQRDTRWSAHLCGTGPKTIGNWGCLLVAYDMLAAHWGINNGRLPADENDYYVSHGGFSGSNLVSMAMSRVYPQVANEGWLSRDDSRMHGRTQDYLARGIPVPARVDFDPVTGQWEQHWILLVGWDGSDYLMNDPWTGKKAVPVADYYGISGSDVLECIYYFLDDAPTPPPEKTVDMLPYFSPPAGTPYGPVTIKDTNWGQGQVRQQIQAHGDYLYVTKGKEFEARKLIGDRIFLITDDSPGNGKYYTVQSVDGWIPRHFTEGQSFTRKETATFFYKSNCSATGESSNWSNIIRFTKFYPTWTTPGGLSFNNVCHLQWLVNGVLEEDYWLAPHVGYVMWGNRHGRQSYIVDMPQGQGNNVFNGACYWPAFGKEW